MTREELMRIAQEVAILATHDRHQDAATRLERFAKLVAAAEREACAKLLDDNWYKTQSDAAAAIRARGEA